MEDRIGMKSTWPCVCLMQSLVSSWGRQDGAEGSCGAALEEKCGQIIPSTGRGRGAGLEDGMTALI